MAISAGAQRDSAGPRTHRLPRGPHRLRDGVFSSRAHVLRGAREHGPSSCATIPRRFSAPSRHSASPVKRCYRDGALQRPRRPRSTSCSRITGRLVYARRGRTSERDAYAIARGSSRAAFRARGALALRRRSRIWTARRNGTRASDRRSPAGGAELDGERSRSKARDLPSVGLSVLHDAAPSPVRRESIGRAGGTAAMRRTRTPGARERMRQSSADRLRSPSSRTMLPASTGGCIRDRDRAVLPLNSITFAACCRRRRGTFEVESLP